jgi:hypothetical protein
MLKGPRSIAKHLDICKTAPLVVLYGTKAGCATKLLMEAMLTIDPAPRLFKWGTVCLLQNA